MTVNMLCWWSKPCVLASDDASSFPITLHLDGFDLRSLQKNAYVFHFILGVCAPEKNTRNLRITGRKIVESQIPGRYFHGGRRKP